MGQHIHPLYASAEASWAGPMCNPRDGTSAA